MKRFLIIGLVLFVVALASGCATVKVDNIVRFTQPIGKIEALTVKIESGFASSKEGTGLKKRLPMNCKRMESK